MNKCWRNGVAGLLLSGVAACGMVDGEGLQSTRASDETMSRSAMRVLHFVPPADDKEYPPQEATFNSPMDLSPGFIAMNEGRIWDSGRYRLQPGVRLSGKVYTAEGSSMEARLRFQGAIDGVHAEGLSLRRGELMTRQDASYDATLVPGAYLVDLIPLSSSWPAQRHRLTLSRDPSRTDFHLQAGANYRGTVSDATGAPLEGVAIRIISEEGELRSQTVHSGNGGTYSVVAGPDPEQEYRIEFAPPQSDVLPRVIFDGLQTELQEETFQLDVQYREVTATTVKGVALTPGGEPAADIPVLLTASQFSPVLAATRMDTGQENNQGHASFQTRTDDAGNFAIAVPQGNWSYTLRLQPTIEQPYGSVIISDFDVSAAPREHTLPSKETVRGQVTDEWGDPVEADVVIRKSIALQENHQILRLRTDENGEFTADLDPGAAFFDVSVTPRDHRSARCHRSTISLSRFQETFIVRTGLKVEGFVADENGRALPRVAVSLIELSTTGTIRTLAESEESTDEEGRFTLLLAPEGVSGCR